MKCQCDLGDYSLVTSPEKGRSLLKRACEIQKRLDSFDINYQPIALLTFLTVQLIIRI